ncbi:MAG: hypothetical protein WC462_03250 [archaeon]
MGLFDFLKAKKENKWAKEKEKAVSETLKKKDLGVCVPNHAKSPAERKKMSKKEINPFDKLRAQHEKEIGREVKEILEQEPEEPYDFAPELGVESVALGKEESEEKKDEIDKALEKIEDGYVPRFSSTARQKLGYETKKEVPKKNLAAMEVKGVYLGSETMISGTILSGKIIKNMSSSLEKGTVRISDIKKGSMTVPELNSGEQGTIFVRGNAAKIKHGDVLDFS